MKRTEKREQKEGNIIKDFAELVDAYEEIEKDLARLVFSVSNRFGRSEECAVCSKTKSHHFETGNHSFIQKIPIPINLTDEVPFSIEELSDEYQGDYKVEHYLIAEETEMKYCCVLSRSDDKKEVDIKDMTEIPLRLIVDLIRSQRIFKFLERITEKMKEKNADYRKIVEIAEKIKVAMLT